MGNVHRIKDRKLIEEEAAAWVWRLEGDRVSAETRAAHEAWLQQDPRHRAVFEDYRTLWSRLDDLAVSERETKIRTVKRGIDEGELNRKLPVPLGYLRYGAIAASLVLALAIAFLMPRPGMEPDMHVGLTLTGEESYSTAVGEQRTVNLADGSVVELNTNTIVSVEYTDDTRLVRLQKGEAHFEVAKNPDRPFIVEADDTSVRAVGTAFNVRVTPEAPVEVIVTEGTVAVTKALEPESESEAPEEAQLVLTAGQMIGDDRAEPVRISSISPNAVEQVLAWRKGMLIFEGEPLENVVEELSRYTEVRFLIVDDEIRNRRVGGYFQTGDVDGLLSILEQGLSVSVEKRGDKLILLTDAEHI